MSGIINSPIGIIKSHKNKNTLKNRETQNHLICLPYLGAIRPQFGDSMIHYCAMPVLLCPQSFLAPWIQGRQDFWTCGLSLGPSAIGQKWGVMGPKYGKQIKRIVGFVRFFKVFWGVGFNYSKMAN